MQLNKFIVYFNIFKIVGLGTFCLPLQQLKNVIQYGQSVISSTNNIESVNKSILESAKVILMEHQFS